MLFLGDLRWPKAERSRATHQQPAIQWPAQLLRLLACLLMLSSLCCFNISRSLASLHARGAFDTEDCCRGYGRQAHNTAEIPTNKHRKEKNTQYKSGRRRRDAWRRTHLPTDSLSRYAACRIGQSATCSPAAPSPSPTSASEPAEPCRRTPSLLCLRPLRCTCRSRPSCNWS